MNAHHALHRAAETGDSVQVIALARAGGSKAVNSRDADGRTPLMWAAASAQAGVETLRALLASGARVEATATGMYEQGKTALAFAIAAADADKARVLLDAGADLHYERDGYSAMIDAAYALHLREDDDAAALLDLLITRGARIDDITRYGESGLSVLSNAGRFAAVGRLLDAGADCAPLRWSALHHAVALGGLAEMSAQLDAGADLEARDGWERTALLLAIQTGDVHKVELLLLHGAARSACGRCGKPALFYAIENADITMLGFLIEQGFSPLQLDDHGCSALAHASECGHFEAVRALLERGMDPDQHDDHRNALYLCQDPHTARLLLDAGADPNHLPFEMRRALAGLQPDPSTRLFEATVADFAAGAYRRFGTRNGERIDDAFWRAMVVSGIDAYNASTALGQRTGPGQPAVWCARRFGQSITFLPDGRVIQVGGEHEDWYDPDFCIYNDVFVQHPDGSFEIYAYPEEMFPPTDFHTATLVEDTIWLIGALGYAGRREPGNTPVYALDTRTLKIKHVPTRGDPPGWIHRHRALRTARGEIRVFGGLIETAGEQTESTPNLDVFALDLEQRLWVRVE